MMQVLVSDIRLNVVHHRQTMIMEWIKCFTLIWSQIQLYLCWTFKNIYSSCGSGRSICGVHRMLFIYYFMFVFVFVFLLRTPFPGKKPADMTFVSSVVAMALGGWHLNRSVMPNVHYVLRVGAGDDGCLGTAGVWPQAQTWSETALPPCVRCLVCWDP